MPLPEIFANIRFVSNPSDPAPANFQSEVRTMIETLYNSHPDSRVILEQIAQRPVPLKIQYAYDDAGTEVTLSPSGAITSAEQINIDPNYAQTRLYLGSDGIAHQMTSERVLLHEIVHAVDLVDDNWNWQNPVGPVVMKTNDALNLPERASYPGTSDIGEFAQVGDDLTPNFSGVTNAQMDLIVVAPYGFAMEKATRENINTSALNISALLIGSDAKNNFQTGGGTDYLYGFGGDDVLKSGDGPDYVDGGVGNDRIQGGGQDDELHGDFGEDTIEGGRGNDTIEGGFNKDTLRGENGNDTIFGGPGGDLIQGGAGFDQIFGEGGNDTVYGGDNRDTIEGGDNNDKLYGEAGRDSILGNDGNDKISGGAENDTLEGNAGQDRIFGNGGNDRIEGGTGNDKILGNGGDDTVLGGTGNDKIFGGDEDDRLFGGSGNDRVLGEDGDDTVNGGTGVDTMFGGMGDDIFYVDNKKDRVSEKEGEGASDTVVIETGGNFKFPNVEHAVVTEKATSRVVLEATDLQSLTLSSADDVVTLKFPEITIPGDAQTISITTGSGADTIRISMPADWDYVDPTSSGTADTFLFQFNDFGQDDRIDLRGLGVQGILTQDTSFDSGFEAPMIVAENVTVSHGDLANDYRYNNNIWGLHDVDLQGTLFLAFFGDGITENSFII